LPRSLHDFPRTPQQDAACSCVRRALGHQEKIKIW
jgi:hypothetical protein